MRRGDGNRDGNTANDSGQAMALGVFGLLILALGMYLVGTFSQHVTQKVHIQTTADAVALSLATYEAQSFNYIAFANRAQVAHYVAALNAQAIVSYMSALEEGALYAANFLQLMGTVLTPTPDVAIGAELLTLAKGAYQLYIFLQSAVDEIDDIAGSSTTLSFAMMDDVAAMNHALWISEMVVASTIESELAVAGSDELFRTFVAQSDPGWTGSDQQTELNAAASAYNVWRYDQSFTNAGGHPAPLFKNTQLPGNYNDQPTAESPDTVKAQRVMTEMINASRWGHFLLGRDVISLPGTLGQVESTVNSIFGSASSITKLVGIQPPFKTPPLIGESKLINHMPTAGATPPDNWLSPSPISKTNQDDSDLSRGGVIANDDEYLWMQGGVWAQAGTGQSWHCRAKRQSPGPVASLSRPIECKDQTADPRHNYKGIAPYMSFQASVAPGSVQSFNQPDVLVFMYKTSQQASFGQPIDFTVNSPNGPITFDTTIGRQAFLNLPPGVLTMARAETYYHRPGNWQEPPNLFNPFWRAHLAPVAQALNNLPGATELGQSGSDFLSGLSQLVTNFMIMH